MVTKQELDDIKNCKHINTIIWEPHLAGARKCLDCGMVRSFNRANFGGKLWDIEEPEDDLKKALSYIKRLEARLRESLSHEFQFYPTELDIPCDEWTDREMAKLRGEK